MLVLFVVLLIGPIIVKKLNVPLNLDIPFDLMQPTGQNNNDTRTTVTGSALHNFGQDAAATGDSDSDSGATATGAAPSAATSAAATGADNPFSFKFERREWQTMYLA